MQLHAAAAVLMLKNPCISIGFLSNAEPTISETILEWSSNNITAVSSGGSRGGGGVQGVAIPPKSSEPYIQNALLILC